MDGGRMHMIVIMKGRDDEVGHRHRSDAPTRCRQCSPAISHRHPTVHSLALAAHVPRLDLQDILYTTSKIPLWQKNTSCTEFEDLIAGELVLLKEKGREKRRVEHCLLHVIYQQSILTQWPPFLNAARQTSISESITSIAAVTSSLPLIPSDPIIPPPSSQNSDPPYYASHPSSRPASSNSSVPVTTVLSSSSVIPSSSNTSSIPPIITSSSAVQSIVTQPVVLNSTSAFDSSTAVSIVVTSVNGQLTTFTSTIPTSLITSDPSKTAANRTAVIAGTTTAVLVLILLALGGIFAYRQHKLRSILTLQGLGKKKEKKGLLDGEEFDDDVVDEDVVAMRRYRDTDGAHATTRSIGGHSTTSSNAPTVLTAPPPLFRARASDSGSIFREEVWPPPGEESKFVDPFIDGVKASSQVDLGRVVDDVMGPGNVAGSSRAGPSSGIPPVTSPLRTDDTTAPALNSSSGIGAGIAAGVAIASGVIGAGVSRAGKGHDRNDSTGTADTSYSYFGQLTEHARDPTSSSMGSMAPLVPHHSNSSSSSFPQNATPLIPTNPDPAGSTITLPRAGHESSNSFYNDPFRDATRMGGGTSVFYGSPTSPSGPSVPSTLSSFTTAAAPPSSFPSVIIPSSPAYQLPPGASAAVTPGLRQHTRQPSPLSSRTDQHLWLDRKVGGGPNSSRS
ncbi:hypothetical protein BDQ12DRAFT_713624 [Crucibulum laeve]|uniref:Uncharacterized protein n=1 Tax=Crucibulum laeve TaxID=68775 RepID=A0A5C3LVU5_9AGAR|nr:hypothetical protein BDQ12DRAFT_713624 [Crucibulum laeve]